MERRQQTFAKTIRRSGRDTVEYTWKTARMAETVYDTHTTRIVVNIITVVLFIIHARRRVEGGGWSRGIGYSRPLSTKKTLECKYVPRWQFWIRKPGNDVVYNHLTAIITPAASSPSLLARSDNGYGRLCVCTHTYPSPRHCSSSVRHSCDGN